MYRTHLLIGFRSLWRQKGFSLINIMGLTIGLTCSLLMFLWVQHQWNYNRFHANTNNIYQVKSNLRFGGGDIETWNNTPYPYSESLKNDFPEVKEVVITTHSQEVLFTVQTQKGKEKGIYANDALFKLFDFPILYGNPLKMMDGAQNLLISETVAKKYFGNLWTSAIGESIKINKSETFMVTGIFADIPTNSSLQFNYVLPFKKILAENPNLVNNYGDYDYNIFAHLQPNINTERVSKQLLANTAKQLEGSIYSVPESMIFQPLADIYLYNSFKNGKVAGGRIAFVRLFFIASWIILIIACVNYMNLATARASKRAKEVGIRKTIGARRGSLIAQFFTEAVIMSGLAVLLAVNFVHLLLPWFNNLTSTQIIIQYNQSIFWLLIGGVFILTTLLSGSYPSLILSSFDINKVLKGNLSSSISAGTLRKGLVVFQFFISAILIMAAVSMRQQMSFLKNKDIGMDRNNMLVIPANESIVKNYKAFKEQLKQNSAIASVSTATQHPTSIGSSTGDPEWEGFTEDKRTIFRRLVADFTFIEDMKIPLVAGRYPSKERLADSTAIIVNEKTAEVMETDNPVGKTLKFWNTNYKIVGVVKDFHINSLHEEIAPLIVVHSDEWFNYLFVRPTAGNTKQALATIQPTYQSLSQGNPFEYEFLDDSYAAMYQSEQTTGALADLFALIALFISSLGLLGLATFSAEQRTKEIGIRKVLGASVTNLVALLSKDFLKLVAVALLVAIPVAYYFIQNWLQNFAYHIDLQWTVFAITIGIALLISFMTVGFQAFRAAIANPVKSIKTE